MNWDYTYILVIIGAVICALASLNVKSTYNKYSEVFSSRGMTSNDVVSMMLKNAGITDVRVEKVSGSLTDHYAPNEKVLRLSETVYGSSSIAAIGVAAHECGHAIQHNVGYGPLKLRSLSVPLANIGSKLSWPIIIIGLIFGLTGLSKFGVALFAFVVIFQLITLPVEFNASSRALQILESQGILTNEENGYAKKVLNAAALTYVAAAFSSILQLLRLIMIMNNGKNSRRR